mgnify:CR=1 FL=1
MNSFLSYLIDKHNEHITQLGYPLNDSFSQKIIKKNIRGDLNQWLKVASDIISIEISKTVDNDEDVLSFIDSQKNIASLWVNKGKIRSITRY